MTSITKKADVLFEVSWEVCNKVGGIYTVLMSKASQANSVYCNNSNKYSHDETVCSNYILIGPYFQDKIAGEFQEDARPEELQRIFNELSKIGLICHYGTWLIKGEPRAILIDFRNFYYNLNNIKKEMWESFKIDSLNCGSDVNDPMLWSYAAGMLIEKMSKVHEGERIVAQFHEWLSGAGLLYLKKSNSRVKTVFTTHATILGRSIASNPNVDLYEVLDKVDSEREAYNYGVQTKHQIEKQSAHNASMFTTVSEITGIEAEHLLGKKPDHLLPNGLDMATFPSFEEVSIRHKDLKFKTKEFILYSFFPSYSFDIDNTLLFFTFARYEFRNKGLDILIDALAKLNDQLQKDNSPVTIVTFFFIPAGVRNIKNNIIISKRYYEDIKDSIDTNFNDFRNNLLIDILSQGRMQKEKLFGIDFLSEIKKKMLRFVSGQKPPICTHDLIDENNDPIMNSFKRFNLDNSEEDKVKVVFYPTYLNGADGLVNLDYYEAILACHLGIFPSFYEPWGYTPLEAGALAVASVTTDLAGFGRYINQQRPKEIRESQKCNVDLEKGIYVIKRQNHSREDVVNQLYDVLYHYSKLSKVERIDNKIEARRLANLADWKNLFNDYIETHNMALDK